MSEIEMYRFVVCVDVLAETLEGAYAELRETLGPDVSYETSDEAYGPDGEEVTVTELNAARHAVLSKEA